MFNSWEYLVQKSSGVVPFPCLRPTFQVIFHVMGLFNSMKMLNNEKLLMPKVWKFLKKTSMMQFLSVKLQTYSLQTATLLSRQLTHYSNFFENALNTSCLKKTIFWEKSVWWTSLLIKLQPCSAQPPLLWKMRSLCKTFS